ncbi:Signal transduction histidine kinase NtrB [Commensalibacter communis]|uniref:two-component system sensor histidine kinase NtrB n=1 Tax=Commensalibacter communis TaxID=2972786 RepID=UPI0022FF682F|nr:ATP-binding protein [Commensalibacter communis]CAI3934574.1 Signal transduction histidine kinase NtrB [Commensalibacter communis]CAI3940304.1 Signal transduction histidine kinase NtrB [Commensalibacter communis]CAI3943622.1 Signal transduction histidine kinase NtrB [Commensalibacter communis]
MNIEYHPKNLNGYDIIESLPTPLIVIDDSFNIVYINGATEDFLMVSKKNIQQSSLYSFFPNAHAVSELIKKVQSKKRGIVEYEVEIFTYNQAIKEITLYIAPFIKNKKFITLTIHDYSIVKTIEEKASFHKVSRSVANMAALLAHEIKNPLSGIKGAAQLLEKSLYIEDQELTTLICDEVERIKNLVDRTAIFYNQKLQISDVNIYSVLAHVKKIAENGFASFVQIKTIYDPSLPLIKADKDLLIQVFINLIKNAAQAIGNNRTDGEITLIIGYEPNLIMNIVKTKKRVTSPLMIVVRDNGPGIPESIKHRLFEPFVSGRPNGTGLGLALCGKIINDHGGIIDIHSQKGKTDIKIYLPLTSC